MGQIELQARESVAALAEDCRKSGQRVSPQWDVDIREQDSLTGYSCQKALARQDPGSKTLQNFFTKFEQKARQILGSGLEIPDAPEFLAEEGLESLAPAAEAEEAETRQTQRLVQNFVDGLALRHEEARASQLPLLYESLVEPTRSEFRVEVQETGQSAQVLQVPELVQNFSSDFWIRKIKAKVLSRESISDEDLIYLLLVRLKFADVQSRGFVLEDFPQNPKQKRILDSHNVVPHLVFLVDGATRATLASVGQGFKRLCYLRLLRETLHARDFSGLRSRALAPPEKPVEARPSDSDPEISENEETPSPVDAFKALLDEDLRTCLEESLEMFSAKEKQLALLAEVVASKLLLKERFELLTVLYSYKEHFDNVRVLDCNKDPLFNLLLVKKSLRCMKAKLAEVLSLASQTKGFRVAGLGLSRANILRNLTFVDGQFICALEFATQGRRELLECSRENMVVVGDVILPVRTDRIQRVVEK